MKRKSLKKKRRKKWRKRKKMKFHLLNHRRVLGSLKKELQVILSQQRNEVYLSLLI